jgi:tetratricopeptide (TPR) repeat protein
MLRRITGALALVLLAAIVSPVLAQTGGQQDPKEAGVHYDKGLDLYKQNKLEEAAEAFNQAIKLKPDYAEAYNELGKTYDALGLHEKARKAYEEAARLKPELAQTQTHGTAGYDDTTRQREIQGERDRATRAFPLNSEVATFTSPPSFWTPTRIIIFSAGAVLLVGAALYFLRRRSQLNT